jgi:hypothetical protein
VYDSTASPDVARGKIEGALEDDFWGTDHGHGGSGTIPDRLSLSRAWEGFKRESIGSGDILVERRSTYFLHCPKQKREMLPHCFSRTMRVRHETLDVHLDPVVRPGFESYVSP